MTMERRDGDDRDEVTDIVLRPRSAAGDMDVDARRIQGSLRSRLFGVKAEPIRIGRFRLGKILGTGGMGVVHEAHDEKLDRKVALKLLHDDREEDEQPRLLREAQALGKLSHPNVVQVYEVGTFEGRVWIAMEFLDGPSLGVWLAAEPRSWREVLDKYLEAGEGLAAAHREGLVHRDLKPANLLLGADQRVRVVDFGLARRLETIDAEDSTQPTPISALLTHTNLAGTPAYMSPEQVNRTGVDARSDQYSFCVALYEALFGERPYQANSPTAILQEIADGRVQPPARPLSSHVPVHVLRAVMKGLSKAPEERFEDMSALLAELRRDPWARRRQVVAVGVIGLLGVGAMWPQTASDPCADVPAPDARSWDTEARDDVEAAFKSSGSDRWEKPFERLDRELATWAEAWTGQRHQVCVAHHVERAQSAELHDRRVRCLDRARREVDAIIDTLRDADAAAVESMRMSAAALPELSQCDGERLLSSRVLPKDPRVAQIENLLSAGSAEVLVGRTTKALDAADAALRVATELEEPVLLAEARGLRGKILRRAGRPVEAVDDFQRAADQFEIAGDDAGRLEAWLGYADAATSADQTERAGLALVIAAPIVERIEAGPGWHGRLLHLRGQWYAGQQALGPAEDAVEQALEHLTQAYGTDALETLEALADLAKIRLMAGRGEEALPMLIQVRDRFEAALGPDEPSLAKVYYDIAHAYFFMERYEEALVPFQRTLELREPHAIEGDVHLVDMYRMYSVLLSGTGDGDAAYSVLLHARHLAEALPPEDPRHVALNHQIAELDFLIGRYQTFIDAELAWFKGERAKGGFEDVLDLPLVQHRLIQCFMALGRPEEARALIVDFLEAAAETNDEFREFWAEEIADIRTRLAEIDGQSPESPRPP